VNAALLDASRVGATSAELFHVAQAAYTVEGFPGEEKFHHQGGPTGYGEREWVATPNGSEVVVNHQAFRMESEYPRGQDRGHGDSARWQDRVAYSNGRASGNSGDGERQGLSRRWSTGAVEEQGTTTPQGTGNRKTLHSGRFANSASSLDSVAASIVPSAPRAQPTMRRRQAGVLSAATLARAAPRRVRLTRTAQQAK
jgi:hypothetical protein